MTVTFGGWLSDVMRPTTRRIPPVVARLLEAFRSASSACRTKASGAPPRLGLQASSMPVPGRTPISLTHRQSARAL